MTEPEPVAWMVYSVDGASVRVTDNPTDIADGERALPLYTDSPRLTDEEIDELARAMVKGGRSANWLARAIEARVRGEEA